MATNKGCGFMANPSWGVNAFAKHIALHLYQYPVAVKWGGNKNIKSLVLAEPTVKPFTEGAKEYGLHFAADAAPSNTAKGITGGVGMLNGGAIDTIFLPPAPIPDRQGPPSCVPPSRAWAWGVGAARAWRSEAARARHDGRHRA